MHEIVWTRILALVLGPTIYAFAATLAAVIGGVALGSALAPGWWRARGGPRSGWRGARRGGRQPRRGPRRSPAANSPPRRGSRWQLRPDLFDAAALAGRLADRGADPADRRVPWRGVSARAAIVGAAAHGRRRPAIRHRLRHQHHRRGVGSLAAGFLFIPALRPAGDAAASSSGCLIAAALAVAGRGRVDAARVARRAAWPWPPPRS